MFKWIERMFCDHYWVMIQKLTDEYKRDYGRVYCPMCDKFEVYSYEDAVALVKASKIRRDYKER